MLLLQHRKNDYEKLQKLIMKYQVDENEEEIRNQT